MVMDNWTPPSRHNSLREKETTHHQEDGGLVKRESWDSDSSQRIPRKFIANWRQACDRTKDKTKELLKRWRTLPESEVASETTAADHNGGDGENNHGWSVHVWATWVRRVPSDEDDDSTKKNNVVLSQLSQVQREKFSHFFSHLLDWDKDELISEQDFENLSERLRHFADWDTNSAEYHVLKEVQNGFVETFVTNRAGSPSELPGFTSLEHWLLQWAHIIYNARNLQDFPLWLRYFCKIIFIVINKSGTGIITRDELRIFYSSFLGFDTQRVGQVLDIAYTNMTSNGDHSLRYKVFSLCFANFLLGRHPHGPGQFLFGPFQASVSYSTMFPIDYSAMNTPPDSLEQYSPNKKSNRHSVVV